jgi:replicative DNA helicase
MIEEKSLPASPEAERAVLGAIILENNLAGDVISELRPEDFYLESHRRIYSAMDSLLNAGKPIETFTLKQELGRGVDAIGGIQYLSGLTDGVPRRSSIDYYVKIIKHKSQRRAIIHAMRAAESRAYEESEDIDEIVTDVQETFSSIEDDTGQDGAKHISEVMGRARQEMEHQSQQEGLLGLTTGIKCLDDATTGIREREVWVVGALPGRGKTAFGVQIAGANASQGVETLVISIEMGDTQVARRLMANHSSVTASKIRLPRKLNTSDWAELSSTIQDIIEWPLWIDDASELTIRQLKARIRLYVRKYKIKLLVVDYLMLIQDPEEKEIRIRAGKIANAIRAVVKEENLRAVILSQISRPAGKDPNKRPTMMDLKESGDIEAAAHVVLLIYMPMSDKGVPTGEDEIIIGKQREGVVGPEEVVYSRKKLMFLDRSEVKEQTK